MAMAGWKAGCSQDWLPHMSVGSFFACLLHYNDRFRSLIRLQRDQGALRIPKPDLRQGHYRRARSDRLEDQCQQRPIPRNSGPAEHPGDAVRSDLRRRDTSGADREVPAAVAEAGVSGDLEHEGDRIILMWRQVFQLADSSDDD